MLLFANKSFEFFLSKHTWLIFSYGILIFWCKDVLYLSFMKTEFIMPKKSRKSTFSRKAPAAKRKAEWRQSQDPDELLANDAKRKRESR